MGKRRIGKRTAAQRWAARIILTRCCWDWKGSKSEDGYGRFWYDGVWGSAHVFSYERFVGPVPEGWHVDHTCRTRGCSNPAHLEAVTVKENQLRSPVAVATINAAKTHCPKGHEYSAGNTLRSSSGERLCRTCKNQKGRAANWWKKAICR